MTTQKWVKKLNARPSTKYTDRYDVNDDVNLPKNLITLSIPFGIVTGHFHCHINNLTSLYNAPIEVHKDFRCSDNQLTTLDHLPKYIGRNLYCYDNPLQNLNVLKDIQIKDSIWFTHETEEQLNYWIKALYNTDLDALEYHYDNHKYKFRIKILERYVMNELEEIIKIKTMKNHLNL